MSSSDVLRKQSPWLLPAAALALSVLLITTASATGRPTGTNYAGLQPGVPELATPVADVNELLQCLLGPDVTVTNEVLIAAPDAAGVFAGALGVIGFDQGIILSSGNIATLAGPNTGDATSTDNLAPGDPDLDDLVPGYVTYDAAILEFDFTCDTAQDVVFQYAFGSEEYNEWVDTPYNDVFGFFLNGTNIAVAPAGCSNAGSPVSINNVNCGNPYIGSGPNCDCFRNNDLDDGGGQIDTEMDGLTQVFYATASISPGTNHIKIAIADAGDAVLDSNVMIRCQSFTCGGAPTVGACCLPGGQCVTLTASDCAIDGGTYFGDFVPCSPTLCGNGFGACCFPDLTCDVEEGDLCASNGGDYQGDGTFCNPDPCGAPLGACCYPSGACILSDELHCGGTYIDDGVSCDPDPCADLGGA
ncbi:MAG: choice-of-anchor L domain-containing protein, partial [Candidatus Eisenbacteria bacterium]